MKNIADIRKEYTKGELEPLNMGDDPLVEFRGWFQQALEAQVLEPNAMVLGTVNAEHRPSSRVVLLKEITADGIVFFTNYASRKGRELLENPFVSAVFFWASLSASLIFLTLPSTLTCRSNSAQKNTAETKGFSKSSRPFLLA